MALLCFFIYRNKLKGVCKMKNLRNKADVEISIQINKKEIGASTVHVWYAFGTGWSHSNYM